VLETAVNFDLPVFADEMVSVRRHDLNLVTEVGKLSKRGHSAIGIDAEIWRVLWHPDLSIDRVSDQQLSWAQLYEKRMRRFNLIGVSVAIVAIIGESIVWWFFFQIM
jgi:hypothetical protein